MQKQLGKLNRQLHNGKGRFQMKRIVTLIAALSVTAIAGAALAETATINCTPPPGCGAYQTAPAATQQAPAAKADATAATPSKSFDAFLQMTKDVNP